VASDLCREREIPVFRSVDGRTIGSGRLGDMTRRLMDLYEARIERDP
jgi:hypothetical protein